MLPDGEVITGPAVRSVDFRIRSSRSACASTQGKDGGSGNLRGVLVVAGLTVASRRRAAGCCCVRMERKDAMALRAADVGGLIVRRELYRRRRRWGGEDSEGHLVRKGWRNK